MPTAAELFAIGQSPFVQRGGGLAYPGQRWVDEADGMRRRSPDMLMELPWGIREGHNQTPPPMTLELPENRMPDLQRSELPVVPTDAQLQPVTDPGLRIGEYKQAAIAQAARERRAQALMELQQAYHQPGQWR